ncbi:MAG: GAF domain-containing protein [Dehalococcoidia bacterium]|nr:GAF domain-containing protein [Dehalococcoidia bacterium]
MQEQERDVAALRANQMEVLAALSRLARRTTSFQDFLESVVTDVRTVFDVEYCKVLELLPDDKELLLRAGAGWLPGLVGIETVETDWHSQAGYTLLKKRPVIVEDLNRERRFNGPALLHLHRVVSGLSVVIHGLERPYGVLGVHSTRLVPFDETDGKFASVVAEIISGTAERFGAGGMGRHSEAVG